MRDQGSREEPESERSPQQRRRPSPLTLLVALVLIIGLGYFLSVKLREMSRLQDCVISGRTNCASVSGGDRQ